ncbi:SidA/IucD/PvdA family monooxygenase [Bradyrhizobium sp.]
MLDAEALPHSELDFIGIGFGPSNIAVAIAMSERPDPPPGLFFEAKSSLQWHPGMMLDCSRMQVSFLKDLVTLRNPASPFTFLQYLKEKGRLERFVNLREFQPTRREFQDYLIWVSEAFRDRVQYGSNVRRVTPILDHSQQHIISLRVDVEHLSSKTVKSYRARNLLYAVGARPNFLEGEVSPAPLIMHSSDFLDRFPPLFRDHDKPYTFAVVGNGQSAAEIVKYVLERFPTCSIELILSGYGFRPADDSPFTNEVFGADEVQRFYDWSEPARREALVQLRNTNYGVVDADLIRSLYATTYHDEVLGTRRLRVRGFSRLLSAAEDDGAVNIVVTDIAGGTQHFQRCDALLLATGYTRELDADLLQDMLPFLHRDQKGKLVASRRYRANTTLPMEGGMYVQGLTESSHGPGDTLLSLLPFRAAEIVEDMCERHTPIGKPAKRAANTQQTDRDPPGRIRYPPRRHVEENPDRLYAVIEEFPFATLISTGNEPIVSHLPMTLDRSRGKKGVLFGHVDRYNPYAESLDNEPVLAIFFGPNAYISPHVYESDQLPTWNSICVHVRGTARRLTDNRDLVSGLLGICSHVDRSSGSYRLSADDPRISKLIDYIVGFEIEIDSLEGKFKLSQDRNSRDQSLALEELIRHTEQGAREFLERICAPP